MRSTASAFVLALLLLPAGQVAAQAPAAALVHGRLITTADLKKWNSIRQTVLSNDSNWLAYVAGPSDSDGTIVIRGTAKDAKEVRIPAGAVSVERLRQTPHEGPQLLASRRNSC